MSSFYLSHFLFLFDFDYNFGVLVCNVIIAIFLYSSISYSTISIGACILCEWRGQLTIAHKPSFVSAPP